mmetsp:Transcript_91727/g.268490  ORF Transcript_91727/g.268490 Transcript_91727/m.268490 type:complete len:213 (-) Transcript_91727:25-663(-)
MRKQGAADLHTPCISFAALPVVVWGIPKNEQTHRSDNFGLLLPRYIPDYCTRVGCKSDLDNTSPGCRHRLARESRHTLPCLDNLQSGQTRKSDNLGLRLQRYIQDHRPRADYKSDRESTTLEGQHRLPREMTCTLLLLWVASQPQSFEDPPYRAAEAMHHLRARPCHYTPTLHRVRIAAAQLTPSRSATTPTAPWRGASWSCESNKTEIQSL